MQTAVFIDRDNTLIANDGDLGDPNKVTLLKGVQAGLQALADAGYALVVITNQGGVARGMFTEHDVDLVHQRIQELVGASIRLSFYYCPYHPDGTVDDYRQEHPWRKPAPGMLLAAADEQDIDLQTSWMVGDQPRDIEAGKRAGCRTVFLGNEATGATYTAADFEEAVEKILTAQEPS